jgi:hypothetical protein
VLHNRYFTSRLVRQVGTPAAKKRIARVWCLPFLGFYDSRCDDHETDLHRRHLALARVRGECGFSDIVSPLWEEEVLTVLPGSGMVLSGKVCRCGLHYHNFIYIVFHFLYKWRPGFRPFGW